MSHIPQDFHNAINKVKEEVDKLARLAGEKGFDHKTSATSRNWRETMASTFKLNDIAGAWEIFEKESPNARFLSQRLAKVHEAMSGGSLNVSSFVQLPSSIVTESMSDVSQSHNGTLPTPTRLLQEMQAYHQINADRIYSNSLGHLGLISRRIAQLYQIPTLASRDSHIRII